MSVYLIILIVSEKKAGFNNSNNFCTYMVPFSLLLDSNEMFFKKFETLKNIHKAEKIRAIWIVDPNDSLTEESTYDTFNDSADRLY